jgi:hypothetical protein
MPKKYKWGPQGRTQDSLQDRQVVVWQNRLRRSAHVSDESSALRPLQPQDQIAGVRGTLGGRWIDTSRADDSRFPKPRYPPPISLCPKLLAEPRGCDARALPHRSVQVRSHTAARWCGPSRPAQPRPTQTKGEAPKRAGQPDAGRSPPRPCQRRERPHCHSPAWRWK